MTSTDKGQVGAYINQQTVVECLLWGEVVEHWCCKDKNYIYIVADLKELTEY